MARGLAKSVARTPLESPASRRHVPPPREGRAGFNPLAAKGADTLVRSDGLKPTLRRSAPVGSPWWRILKSAVAVLFTAVALHAIDFTGCVPIGNVTGASAEPNGVLLTCADGSTVHVVVLAPDLVRVRTLFPGQSAVPDHSWAIARSSWETVPVKVQETPSAVTLTTSAVEVVINKSPLLVEFRDPTTNHLINADEQPMTRDPKTGRVGAAKRLGLDEHFYGLGEKAALLDRRRGQFTLWNSDTPGYVLGTDPIYQSIPFYVGLENGRGYGLFYDNSYRTTFDFGHTTQDYAGYLADGGVLDYYFFAGPSLKQIVSRYTELTGRMPLPPLWALGNQQCRYSYYPAAMVEEIAHQYRARDLPLDVLYLDIHYMDGFRVFTWNHNRFPDPLALTAKLAHEGIKLVTILDPGVKYQPEGGYSVYDDGAAHDYFLHRANGSLYIGEVWPGKAVFVDYTREDARRWWGDQLHALVDRGVAGIWTDMNEPSDFIDKSGESQRDVIFDDLGTHTPYAKNRNVFALNMARATYEGLARLRPNERPFVITRAAYAGVQRYSTMWIGDSNATFDGLALSIPMYASLGLSGETFVGGDLPGFIGRGSGELIARAYEVAAFVPLCRNHGAIDDYDHEPWRYGAAYESVVRKYLKLRYRMLPFLYTTLEEAHRTGVPLFRPLLLNFQDDPNTQNLDDEFMVGDALLAAPVVVAGARSRDVYLPPGRWYDFWTDRQQAGGDMKPVTAPLDIMPLYVRGGSIIPSTDAMQFVTEKPWNPLRFDVYPDADGAAHGSLYEDDGISPQYESGAYRRTAVDMHTNADGVTITVAAPQGTYAPPARDFELRLHGDIKPRTIEFDGRPLAAADGANGPAWSLDDAGIVHIRFADDAHAHTVRLLR